MILNSYEPITNVLYVIVIYSVSPHVIQVSHFLFLPFPPPPIGGGSKTPDSPPPASKMRSHTYSSNRGSRRQSQQSQVSGTVTQILLISVLSIKTRFEVISGLQSSPTKLNSVNHRSKRIMPFKKKSTGFE